MSSDFASEDPRIPAAGLGYVVRHYAGRGNLVRDIAAIATAGSNATWTERDLLLRAELVALRSFSELIDQLPSCSTKYWNHIPPRSSRLVSAAAFLTPRADWTRSIRRYGWPLARMLQTDRYRTRDSVHEKVLSWTSHRLAGMLKRQRLPEPSSGGWAGILAVHRTINSPPPSWAPSREELADLTSDGGLWRQLAQVATELVRLDRDPVSFALAAMTPDPTLVGTLFQIAVAGCTLKAASEAGSIVSSLRPIGIGRGPHYRIEHLGSQIDVWIEAGGAWDYYGWRSRYRLTCRALSSPSPLSPDILFTDGRRFAICLECKCYSLDNTRDAVRDGLVQSMAYLDEMAATGAVPSRIAISVLPDAHTSGLVIGRGSPSGRVGLATPTSLSRAIRSISYLHRRNSLRLDQTIVGS